MPAEMLAFLFGFRYVGYYFTRTTLSLSCLN